MDRRDIIFYSKIGFICISIISLVLLSLWGCFALLKGGEERERLFSAENFSLKEINVTPLTLREQRLIDGEESLKDCNDVRFVEEHWKNRKFICIDESLAMCTNFSIKFTYDRQKFVCNRDPMEVG